MSASGKGSASKPVKAVLSVGKVAGSIQRVLFAGKSENTDNKGKGIGSDKDTLSGNKGDIGNFETTVDKVNVMLNESDGNKEKSSPNNIKETKKDINRSSNEVLSNKEDGSNNNKNISNKNGLEKDKAIEVTSDSNSSDEDSGTVKESNTKQISQRLQKVRFGEAPDENSDDESSDESQTKEDSDNTVNSGETTTISKKNMNKVVLPPFTRYQIMILLDQENKQNLVAENDDDDEKAPLQRLRDVLVSMTTQIKIFDEKAKIISWKTSPNFSYMNMDDFPTEIAQIAMYFNGYRANVKADKRIYLRVGLHTPNSQSALFSFLTSWMELYGYSCSKCIIQAENSACIGWLAYSTSFTDPEVFRERLVDHSNFEWGFKLMAVTNSDKDKPWIKRLKAIGVHVPSKMQSVAKLIIGRQLEASMDSQINIPDFTDKFLYVEPEKKMNASKGGQVYYRSMVERHRIHCNSIQAEFSFGIATELDREFCMESSDHISLRDIILDLKVEDRNSPLFGTRLFHSVDFWADSSQVWIENNKG